MYFFGFFLTLLYSITLLEKKLNVAGKPRYYTQISLWYYTN